MSNKPESSNKKRKGVTAGVVICFIAAIAAVGTYTVRNYQNRVAEELALAEEESNQQANVDEESTVTNNLIVEEDDAAELEAESETESEEQETEDTQSQETGGDTTELNFTAEDKLLWPVSGDVIMNYSMDQTVYFATLDQYKYNPALIISAAVNDQVLSASKGLVKSIDLTADTGTTVTIDMGNGYEAVYGQLKEVAVKSGDYVEAKTVLGYISEPTKYYSVEGSNLYFEIRKDGLSVNPMEFLE